MPKELSVDVICGSAEFVLEREKRENRITVTPADHKECGQAACTGKPNMWSHTHRETGGEKRTKETKAAQHHWLIAGKMGGNDRTHIQVDF